MTAPIAATSDRRLVQIIILSLTIIMVVLSVVVWLNNIPGAFTIYSVFPVFGLLAFILMGMHYVTGALKRYYKVAHDESLLRRYFNITAYIVLALILLHPALLYIGLYLDGAGLPPTSAWLVYPEVAARVALLMGSVTLTAFLFFELRRWFKQKPWWKYVEYASVVAMALIFVHSMTLGGELMSGWFRIVWIAFGWLVALSIVYTYTYDKNVSAKE